MTANPLGRVNVATPGTLVPLSTNTSLRASKIYFQVIPGLTGKGYIGKSGLVRATLVNVIRGRIFGLIFPGIRRGQRRFEPLRVLRRHGRGRRGAAGHVLVGVGR